MSDQTIEKKVFALHSALANPSCYIGVKPEGHSERHEPSSSTWSVSHRVQTVSDEHSKQLASSAEQYSQVASVRNVEGPL